MKTALLCSVPPPLPLIRLLGLCNNFAYVVMLSAAHDILEKQESKNSTSASDKLTVDFRAGNSSNSSGYDCSPVTTGVRGDSAHNTSLVVSAETSNT
ncbi:hypothetical protein ATANTOWER_030350 [Ataeniobius toweri]|uniref:Uncharacterized protein n=1 Tax=Ataeniobius toweri TaxID=208326 RepID=A0ABU7C195_9TELE|nr:hypothetical protein [Ataeniobius toweri]